MNIWLLGLKRTEKSIGLGKPPPVGNVKKNFDAAVRGRMSYLSAVCRNPTGGITHSWGAYHLTRNPLLAESKAAWLACQGAKELDMERVIIEGDSVLTCQAVNELNFLTDGPVADCIHLTKELMKENREWRIQWAPRSQNVMAHLLAGWVAVHNRFGAPHLDELPLNVLHADIYFETP